MATLKFSDYTYAATLPGILASISPYAVPKFDISAIDLY